MYFKQIEIQGFKSFADRTVVNLEDGMTAVVGPNGCGKSNILDALRWALGEQSAKMLRGAHMQDVIFNGSEERSPMGMAEVTLTFDNSDSALPLDFSEVQVSRRVYRSGESEYLINKSPCRLRDVQELFMDTGVGTNAYSMIGQGKIAMVLSSKPDDRRYLFEEAAGIIKYKSRKRVAVRELDQAEQNHLRLCDVIAELERQMRALKRQVNAAIRYRALTQQLKELEVRASWIKFVQLTAEIERLQAQFGAAQDLFEKSNAELSQFEARYEEVNLKKLEIDRVLHARRERVHEIDGEMEKVERQIALIRQQIEFSHEQQARAQAEQETLVAESGALSQQSASVSERLGTLREERRALEAAVSAKQEDYRAASDALSQADAVLESTRAQKLESMGMRAKAQTAIERLTANIDNIEAQLSAIYERQESASVRMQELAAELESCHAQESLHQSRLADLVSAREELADQIRVAQEALRATHEERQAAREKKSSVDARLRSLRELRDSYEGFASGVRAIMQEARKDHSWSDGVLGPVGDLVSAPRELERAIEAALGGSINNIVVEHADVARDAIRYLNAKQAGRVTFLPLDTVRPSPGDRAGSILNEPGVVGRVIERVQFDGRVAVAMEYLFSDTVIVEGLDAAVRIARGKNAYPRMVTLDGEVVSSSGAVTGGRTQHESRGLLGRSAEIAELETEAARLGVQISELESMGNEQASALESLDTRSREFETNEGGQRKEINDLGMAVARLATELDNLRASSARLSVERDTLIQNRETFEAERLDSLQMASAMETEDETLQRAIAESQSDAARARQGLNTVSNELSDLRVNLANLTKNVEQAEQELARLEREREHAERGAEGRLNIISELQANREQMQADTKDNLERSKALSETKEEARQNAVQAENERQKLLDDSEGLEKELKTVRERVRETQRDVHQHELDLRRNEDQLAFFNERILDEYGIALASLDGEQVGSDDLDDATREERVTEIRGQLDRMGNVNLMAIEEYEALTERHQFLTGQEEDLRLAREALMAVINRIDSTIRQMFLDTFNTVADNFRQYFRRLFNGGQARIYLLDEDDPLESGIEIEARPPGKKPQSISLLSGGEQAMTAISLLFSIFKAKPSPFCVLDEVDAPLDDANIGRFVEMVEEFASDTQFIVITHSKQTMARAAVVYGVTMQERGVSTLVSVKFDGVVESAEPAA